MPLIDFSNVEERSFEPLPVGRYEVIVTSASVKDGKVAPYLALELAVVEGEYLGRKLFDNMSFAPAALFKLKGALRAFGYDDDELAGQFEFDPDDLLTANVGVKVGQETNDDELRNRVKGYFELD